jgi:hypothetical protein
VAKGVKRSAMRVSGGGGLSMQHGWSGIGRLLTVVVVVVGLGCSRGDKCSRSDYF